MNNHSHVCLRVRLSLRLSVCVLACTQRQSCVNDKTFCLGNKMQACFLFIVFLSIQPFIQNLN